MAMTPASRQAARAVRVKSRANIKLQRQRTRSRIQAERERKKNAVPGEWDGFHGRGQRARKYWWSGFPGGKVEKRGQHKQKKRYAGKPQKMAKSMHKPKDWF